MHEQSHTIYRLAVHLPEQQSVYYREGEEALAADRACTRNTHLTAWFELNNIMMQVHTKFYTLIYQSIMYLMIEIRNGH